MKLIQSAMAGQGFKFVRRSLERQTRQCRDFGRKIRRKFRRGIQTRAHCRTTLRQEKHIGQVFDDARLTIFHCRTVARKLLPQGNWGGVLGVGTANFNDVGKFGFFGLQCGL